MLASSRPLSMTEFISRSTMDPDGNRFLQSVHRYPNIHRSLYTAWSLDVTHRHPTHYRTVPTKNQLFEDTKVGGRGALSLENLIRRQIVSRYLNDLSEDILEDVEWYRLAKKVWEDILRAGEDSFKVFSRFCTVYGHEPDFIAMLELSPSSSGMKPEAVGADGSMTLQLGKHFMSVKAYVPCAPIRFSHFKYLHSYAEAHNFPSLQIRSANKTDKQISISCPTHQIPSPPMGL